MSLVETLSIADHATSGLTSSDFSLLLAISEESDYPISPGLVQSLVRLRNRGLIRHNEEHLRDSKVVRLTSLGARVIASLSVIAPDSSVELRSADLNSEDTE
jgi:DNA-binding PadR family transcriptional regulator